MSIITCRSTNKGGERLSCEYEQSNQASTDDAGGKDRQGFNLGPVVIEPSLDLYIWDRNKTPKLKEYPISTDPDKIGKGTGKFATDRTVDVVTVDERKPKSIEAPEGQYFVEKYNTTDKANKALKGANKVAKGVSAATVGLDIANFYLENRDEIHSVLDFAQKYGESIVHGAEAVAQEAFNAIEEKDLARLGTIVVDNVVPVTFAGRFADNVANELADVGVISKADADAVDEITDQVSDNFVDQAVNRVLDPMGALAMAGVKPTNVIASAWSALTSLF